MATQPIFPATVKNGALSIANVDGTNTKQLLAAGASGTKVESILASSTDTNPVVLQFIVTIGGTDYVIGEVSIPAGAGTDGATKAKNVLNTTDLPWLSSDGRNPYILLATGSTLRVKAKTTVTSGKTIALLAQAGDY